MINPLEQPGYVWLSKGILTLASRLMERDKSSESSIVSEAKAKGWETRSVGGQMYCSVPTEWIKTQLGIENITPDYFFPDGTPKRLLSKRIRVSVVGDHELSQYEGRQAERLAITEELTSRLSIAESQAQVFAQERDQLAAKLEALQTQLNEAKRKATQVDALEAAIRGRDDTIAQLGQATKILATQTSVDQLTNQLKTIQTLLEKKPETVLEQTKNTPETNEEAQAKDVAKTIEAAFLAARNQRGASNTERRRFGQGRQTT